MFNFNRECSTFTDSKEAQCRPTVSQITTNYLLKTTKKICICEMCSDENHLKEEIGTECTACFCGF